jgi:hypothetical protein
MSRDLLSESMYMKINLGYRQGRINMKKLKTDRALVLLLPKITIPQTPSASLTEHWR